MGNGRSGATRPRSARNSEMSRTFAENLRALSWSASFSGNKCEYSFSVEPQPAALVMMASKSSA